MTFLTGGGGSNPPIIRGGGIMIGSPLPVGTVSPVLNRLSANPIFIPFPQSFAKIACRVGTAGGAGSTARLGIYNDNGQAFPGTLFTDAGTVAVDTTGVKTITFASPLTLFGLYWLAYEDIQVTSAPTVNATNGCVQFNGYTIFDIGANQLSGFFDPGHSGALPATWPGNINNDATFNPLVYLAVT